MIISYGKNLNEVIMKNQINIVQTKYNKMFIGVVEVDNGLINITNPLYVDIIYNEERMPVFNYTPWQILTDEELLVLSESDIIFNIKAKKELSSAYRAICSQFSFMDDD